MPSPKTSFRIVLILLIFSVLGAIVSCMTASAPISMTSTPASSMPTSISAPTSISIPSTETPGAPSYESTNSSNTTPSNVVGQVRVEYPKLLYTLTSDSVFVYISIPSQLAAVEPASMTRVPVSLDEINPINALGEFSTNILLASSIRVDLSSLGFQVAGLYQEQQYVDLKDLDRPTEWAWTIMAPVESGTQVFVVRVFLENDKVPIWLGSFDVDVQQPIPIPTITPTGTPAPTPVPLTVKVVNNLVNSISLEVCLGIPAAIAVIVGLYAQLRKQFKKGKTRGKGNG